MSYLLPGKRSKELAAVADANRLSFSQEDSLGCTDLPFTLFVQGTGHAAQNVMVGRLHGMTVRGFDFPYLRNDRAIAQAAYGEPGKPPVIPYEEGKQYGCALVALTVELPFLHIAPRAKRRMLPPELEMRPAHAELARHYQLWALDHAAVGALFTEALADFLAGTRGQFEFELCGPGVMSMVNGVKAEDFPKFMAMTVRFAEALRAAVAAAPAPPPPVAPPSDPAPPTVAIDPAPPAPAAPLVRPVPVPAPVPPAPVRPAEPAAPAAPAAPATPTTPATPATPATPTAPAASAPAAVPVGVAAPETSEALPPPPAAGADLPLPPAPPDAATAPLPPPPA